MGRVVNSGNIFNSDGHLPGFSCASLPFIPLNLFGQSPGLDLGTVMQVRHGLGMARKIRRCAR